MAMVINGPVLAVPLRPNGPSLAVAHHQAGSGVCDRQSKHWVFADGEGDRVTAGTVPPRLNFSAVHSGELECPPISGHMHRHLHTQT